MWFVMPILLVFTPPRFYTTVPERHCQVYILFRQALSPGLTEPGLQFLPFKLGPSAFLVNWLGSRKVVDLRLDQQYLRSQPVNSEEGAPMGIGIWYEMYISDPVSYLFKNADPRGSLAANVSNSVVRSLSNMPLEDAGQPARMSRPCAKKCRRVARVGLQAGFGLHPQGAFPRSRHDSADRSKVVNRLRQVTSRHQAGRRQPGQHHRQHRRTPGASRVCQGRGHPSAASWAT
jgi:hypothetical protein